MRNEIFGWAWILAGFVSGAVLGLFFHRADFLGGYDAYRRRLIRLAHISFFGLGFVNVLFAESLTRASLAGHEVELASWAMIVGGVSMPLCCVLNAWRSVFKFAFAVPVGALITGALTLLRGLIAT